jgi:putative hydrolase of the HAD superfamily
MKHNALLLDFGGVISKTLFECHDDTERYFGLPPGTLLWRGPLDPEGDELWRTMLAEEITEREYWRRRAAELGQMLGRTLEARDLIGATRGDDPNRIVRPEAVATIHKAKAAGRRVGVLSNELELFYGREVLSRLTILNDVDCVVDGSSSHVLKPSPAAYARALDALGTTAERTVFVDDQPRNVAGARAIGMTAVAFDVRDPAASFREIERLLEM